MTKTDFRFLEALRCSLTNEKVQWSDDMLVDDWMALFQQAEKHHVLPLIFEAVYDCSAAQLVPPELMMQFRQRAVRQVTMQTIRTRDFLRLNKALRGRELRPLAVKGIICRELYPNPDYRVSGDEDVLIGWDAFEACHKAMLEEGMQLSQPDENWQDSYEVPYGKLNSPLYIELHKEMFSHTSEAYGDWNRYFEDAIKNGVDMNIYGTPVLTMEPTQHLFYLICHAFKHFMHSGFGIRQVCDIVLFAQHYGKEIRWDYMMTHCREINAEYFAAALFRMGTNYLGVTVALPNEWVALNVDELPLLEDLLAGGIYGGSSMGRQHSSNVTLNAVSANKTGKKAAPLMKSLFPTAKYLESRYPYLKKYPVLLPVAWVQRVVNYRKEMAAEDNNSLEIGNARVELMRKYRIIK